MDDPWERANQLSSSTSVPTPFEVVYAIKTKHPSDVEKWVHQTWKNHRVAPEREFFKNVLRHHETKRELTEDQVEEAYIRSMKHAARIMSAWHKREKAKEHFDRVRAVCDYEFMQQVESHK